MEHKWFVDEAYQFLILNPYAAVSSFLADKVDWAFWHDWFHDKVIAGRYNWLSRVLLNEYADQRGIDAVCQWPGQWHARDSPPMLRVCRTALSAAMRWRCWWAWSPSWAICS